MKQNRWSLGHSQLPCQSYWTGNCLAHAEGSGRARWSTSSLWLCASLVSSNSKTLLRYRWAQTAPSVPRPAAKVTYPWNKGYFKRVWDQWEFLEFTWLFLLFGIKCCMWCFKWWLWFKLHFGFNCKVPSSLPPPEQVTPANQRVTGHCLPSSLVWCSAVTSWTESSVEALSPWGLSLQQKEKQTVLYTGGKRVSSFTEIKGNQEHPFRRSISRFHCDRNSTDAFACTQVSV